jgi:polyvinyl alcohol dehydrogenase (cytochrome)
MRSRIAFAPVVTVIVGFALAAPALATAACQSSSTPGGDWRSYGHDAANSRTQHAETALSPTNAQKLHAAWAFSTASAGDVSGAINSTPIVADGCVFVGSGGGVVYALDQSTGAVQWKRRLDAPQPGFGGGLVGAPAVANRKVFVLVNETGGPYAVALDEGTGALLWRSAPVTTYPGSYTNASSALYKGLLFMGFSAPEGDSNGQGGWALIDTATGAIRKVTDTIPPADQARGFAGGGIWSTPAFDVRRGYAYVGGGNPFSKTQEHPFTNSILKIDVNASRSTFGQVVAFYKGNPDQYTNTLETLRQTPICRATDTNGVPYPLDDPACGQLDLDFGASPNLFVDAAGTPLVGELQKSGVYHAARGDSMAGRWSTLVGLSCAACNAASSAYDGTTIYGAASPGSTQFALDPTTGVARWEAAIGDGTHYQSTSVAAGVVYTIDGAGFLDAWDGATGQPVLRHPLAQDTGTQMTGLTSSGVAVADHTVFVTAGGSSGTGTAGYVVAYR